MTDNNQNPFIKLKVKEQNTNDLLNRSNRYLWSQDSLRGIISQIAVDRRAELVIDELQRIYKTKSTKLLLIVAPSGGGKSSLVRIFNKSKNARMEYSTDVRMIDLDDFGFRDENKNWVVKMKALHALETLNRCTIAVGAASNWLEWIKEFPSLVMFTEPEVIGYWGVQRDADEKRPSKEPSVDKVKDFNYYVQEATKFFNAARDNNLIPMTNTETQQFISDLYEMESHGE